MTTECADCQSVVDPALGVYFSSCSGFSDGQTLSRNVMKLMVVALAGWINQQQEDGID
jgi:hypothetical protein